MKKTAIVTGASGDIGKEIARFLLEKNYTVVGIYFNNNEALDELIDIYGIICILLNVICLLFPARKFQTMTVKIILM